MIGSIAHAMTFGDIYMGLVWAMQVCRQLDLIDGRWYCVLIDVNMLVNAVCDQRHLIYRQHVQWIHNGYGVSAA